MQKLSATIIAIMATLIAGCAATGPENSQRTNIASPLTSEATFRNLNRMVQTCLDNFAIQAMFYPEAKEGEITLKSRGDIFTATWIAITVKPASTGATAEVIYRNIYEIYTKPMQSWATGEKTSCS
jgi:hypothetical protein